MAKSITRKEGYKKNPTQTTQVNAYDQWVYFVLLAIVVLLPITISLISLDRFDTPKLVIMRLATFLAIVFWSLKIVRLKEREIRWTKLDFILLGFLALTVVSTILSINVGLSINGRYTRYEGLLTFLNYAGIYFLALQTFTSFGRIKALGQFLALVGGAVSIYGLLQFAGLDLIAWPDLPFEEKRSFATFGNPDFLAGFLVLTLPTALASFLSSKDAKDNIAYGFNFFLVAACLLTTYTRGAWIAALICLLIFIVLLRKSVFAHSKKLIIIASIFILSFAFVAFYSSSNSSINLIERLASTARITEGSAGNRLEIWKASIDAIKDRPLFGFGPDTFNLLSQKYETLRYVKMMRGNSTSDNAHNYLLQLSACIGLPATVCFVVFVLAAIYSAIHIIYRRDIEQRIMYTGLAASSAGYLIHLLFGLSLVGSSTIFWLILGATLTQSQIVHKLNIKLKPAYIISLLAIIVVIIMNYYALTIFVADHYYLKGILADRAGYPNQAMLYLDKSIGLYKNGKYFDEYSRYLQDLGLARQDLTLVLKGKDLAEAATNFEPDHANHWITLANAYAALTRKPEDEYFKESKKALIKALKIRPYSTTAHLLLGNIYKVEGNYNKAIEMLEFVQSVDPEEKDAYLMAAEIYKATGKKSLALNQYLKYISLNPNDQKVQQIIQELKAN